MRFTIKRTYAMVDVCFDHHNISVHFDRMHSARCLLQRPDCETATRIMSLTLCKMVDSSVESIARMIFDGTSLRTGPIKWTHEFAHPEVAYRVRTILEQEFSIKGDLVP